MKSKKKVAWMQVDYIEPQLSNPWWEDFELSEDLQHAMRIGKKFEVVFTEASSIVKYFNDTRKPGEHPRKVLQIRLTNPNKS